MKKYLLLLSLCIIIFACQQPSETKTYVEYTKIRDGRTMGTSYNITYSSATNYQTSIDSILIEINQQVNTYDSTALISQFNKGTELSIEAGEPQHFSTNYSKALEINQKTEGFFDPTVMPLVYYWGFGKNKKAVEDADPNKIRELLTYIGLENIELQEFKVGKTVYLKKNPNTQLDFSAIAKGYAVDKIGEFLKVQGVENYLVEIGGETVTRGKNERGDSWTLGIVEPSMGVDPSTQHKALVQISGKGMATSGDYMNYYEVNGAKYGHTLNPKTGYSAMSNVLSATVVAENCMTADGYATGFMAMGIEKAFEIANSLENLEAYFIYDDNGTIKTKFTEGMKTLILQENQ